MNELREMITDMVKFLFKGVGCLILIGFILGCGTILVLLGAFSETEEVENEQAIQVEEVQVEPDKIVPKPPKPMLQVEDEIDHDFKSAQRYNQLITRDGNIYKDILISRVEGNLVSFMHENGAKRIHVNDIQSVR